MTDPNDEETRQSPVSWSRKIIILLFIIGFWVFFYWYQETTEPPKQPPQKEIESPSATRETAPPVQ